MKFGKIPALALTLLLVCVCCVSVVASADYGQNNGGESQSEIDVTDYLNAIPRMKDGDSIGFTMKADNEDAYDLSKLILQNFNSNELSMGGTMMQQFLGGDLISIVDSTDSWEEFVIATGGIGIEKISVMTDFNATGKKVSETDFKVTALSHAKMVLDVGYVLSDYYERSGFTDDEPCEKSIMDVDFYLKAEILLRNQVPVSVDIQILSDGLLTEKRNYTIEGYATLVAVKADVPDIVEPVTNTVSIHLDQTGIGSVADLNQILNGKGNDTALNLKIFLAHDYDSQDNDWETGLVVSSHHDIGEMCMEQSLACPPEQVAGMLQMLIAMWSGEDVGMESTGTPLDSLPMVMAITRMIVDNPGYTSISEALNQMGYVLTEDSYFRAFDILNNVKSQVFDFNKTHNTDGSQIVSGYAVLGKLKYHESLKDSIASKVTTVESELEKMQTPMYDGNYDLRYNVRGTTVDSLIFGYTAPLKPFEIGSKINGNLTVEQIDSQWSMSDPEETSDVLEMTYSEYQYLGTKPVHVKNFILDGYISDAVIDCDIDTLSSRMSDTDRTNLHGITINGHVGTIASGTFRNCTNLEVVNIESVDTIENNAFYGCLYLSGFIQNKSVAHIADEFRAGYTGPYGNSYVASYNNNSTGSYTVTLTSSGEKTSTIRYTSYEETYYGMYPYQSASNEYYSRSYQYSGAGSFTYYGFTQSTGTYQLEGDYVHLRFLAYVENILIEADVYAPASSFTGEDYQTYVFAETLHRYYASAVEPQSNPNRVLEFGEVTTINDSAFNTLEKADCIKLLKKATNVGFHAFNNMYKDSYDSQDSEHVMYYLGKVDGEYVAFLWQYEARTPMLQLLMPEELGSQQSVLRVTDVYVSHIDESSFTLHSNVKYYFKNDGAYHCKFIDDDSIYTVVSDNGYDMVMFDGRLEAISDTELTEGRTLNIPNGITDFNLSIPSTASTVVTPESLKFFVPQSYIVNSFHLVIGESLENISSTRGLKSASISGSNTHFRVSSDGGFTTLIQGNRILAIWGNGTVFTVPDTITVFDLSSLSFSETITKVIIGNQVKSLAGNVTSGSINELVIGSGVETNTLQLHKPGMTITIAENRALGNYIDNGVIYLNHNVLYVNETPANGILNTNPDTAIVYYYDGIKVYCLPLGAYTEGYGVAEDAIIVSPTPGPSVKTMIRIDCDYLQTNLDGVIKRPFLSSFNYSYNYKWTPTCNTLFTYRVVGYDEATKEVTIRFTTACPEIFGIGCSTDGVTVKSINENSFDATVTAVVGSTKNVKVDLIPKVIGATFVMGSEQYVAKNFSFLNKELPENSGHLLDRAGLLFAGWYEDSAYTKPYTGVINDKVTTYYAKYVPYTDLFCVDESKGTANAGAVNGLSVQMPSVTAKEGYEFLGWGYMGQFIPVAQAADITVPYGEVLNSGLKITALFKKTQLPTYEVKYILNGEIYDSKTKTEGDIIYNAPLRDNDAFQYWSIDDNPAKMFNIVRGNMTFIAVIETFTVTWTDEDGTVLDTKTVGKGTVPEYGAEVPTKKSTDAFEYEFAGWDPVVTAIDGDTVYKATYNEFPLYTVTWKNYDGTVLDSIKVRKDTVPEYNGELPLKDADARYTYQFDKWSPAMEAVTSDTVYVATFKVATELDYTITWKNYDGTILQSSKVKYAETPAYDGPAPVRNSTDRADYEFSSWSPAVAVVTGEAVYTAQFTEYALHYITWKNHDGTVLATSAALRPGVSAEYSGATPEKTAEHYEYVFKDWSKSEAANGDITCTATFTETPKNYPVVFIVDGEREESQAPYGSLIVLPAEPVFDDGRVFVRWAGYQYGITVGEINEFTAEYTRGTIESENGKTTKTYGLDDGSTVTVIADENTGVVSTNTSKTVEDGDKTTVTKEEVVTDLSGKPLGSTETVTETVVDETAGSTLVNNQVTQKDASGNTTQTVTDTTLTRTDSTTVSKEVVDANGNSSVTADSQVKAESVSGTVKVEDSVIDNALNDLATVTENTSANATKDLTVTVKSDDTESSSATTTVSKDALGKVSDAGAKLALEAGVGNVTIDANVAKNLSEKQIDGEVSLNIRMADKATMTSQQRNVVGNATVIELTAKVGNESVHQLGGVATITVPYALKYWENPDNIKVWYITDDGHYYLADSVVYSNLNGGTVTFTTTHFSMYVISTEANLGSAHGDFVETIPLVCVSLIAVACIIAAAFAVASAARKRD